MDWLEIAIEEYKTLREESLTSMKMQQSILTFGTATIGLIITTGFNVWDKTPLPEILFLFLAPAIVYLIILVWLGEVGRMFRAGRFIADIEDKINLQFPGKEKALTWENWLLTRQNENKTPHHILQFHYVSIFLLFAMTSLGSIIIGNLKIYTQLILRYIILIDLVEITFLLIIIKLAIRSSTQIGHNMQKRI